MVLPGVGEVCCGLHGGCGRLRLRWSEVALLFSDLCGNARRLPFPFRYASGFAEHRINGLFSCISFSFSYSAGSIRSPGL